jgi:hypothetical protein
MREVENQRAVGRTELVVTNNLGRPGLGDNRVLWILSHP